MKPLRLPAAFALAGALALFFLFPRSDPSALYPSRLDRKEAIQRARRISAQYGIDASRWSADVSSATDSKLRAYRSGNSQDPAGKLFTPIWWLVLLHSPGAKQLVEVRLFADGRLAGWQIEPPPSTGAALSITADLARQDLAGAYAVDFTPAESGAKSKAGVETQAWEWQSARRFPFSARIEVSSLNGRISAIHLKPDYHEEFNRRYRQAGHSAVQAAIAIIHFLAFCLAMVFLVIAWPRRRFTWRAPALLAVFILIWGALSVWNSPDYRAGIAQASRLDSDDSPAEQGGEGFALIVGYFNDDFLPLLTFLVFGLAGYCRASSAVQRKWLSIEALGQGGILTRQVSRPIAAGALCGIAAAAVPYLIASLPFFHGAALDFRAINALAAPMPALRFPPLQAALPAIAFLGFIWPLGKGIRAKWLGISLLVLAGIVFTISSGEVFNSLPPTLIAGAILVAIYFEIYRRFDLLAAIAAMLAARAALQPAVLMTQSLGSLRQDGLQSLFLLLIVITAFVSFSIRGRETALAALPDLPDSDDSASQSSKERLEAEFQVARRAQQDALPEVPPAIDGLSFAAACQPAQQVGGDLYDFFTLPDGKLGIAVADVSGKGVPAALYMMVTKGLLAAATRDSSDLAAILENLNTHLYRACKRKVFVTMAAVTIDPARRRLEYGRAGHNPIVWRRVQRGETLLLQPHGLGLGISGHDLFARHLRIEEFDLEPGDAVVLYSDGITEAENAAQEQFGEDRLLQAVAASDGRSALETRDALLRRLDSFTAGTPAHDDVTLVVVRVAAWPDADML